MQTWFVHMRRPWRLLRELHPAGAIAFQLLLAANVLAALIHPAFMVGLGYAVFVSPDIWTGAAVSRAMPVFAATLVSGYASTIVLGIIGLRRRGLLRLAWVLVLTPLYWFVLSLAAWRALFQLLLAPQRWEKTEHGKAKTSRLRELRQSYVNPRVAVRSRTRPVAASAPAAPTTAMASMGDPMMRLGQGSRRAAASLARP